MNWKKYAVGFAIFAGYYLIMRNIENKISAVKSIANIGGGSSAAS